MCGDHSSPNNLEKQRHLEDDRETCCCHRRYSFQLLRVMMPLTGYRHAKLEDGLHFYAWTLRETV